MAKAPKFPNPEFWKCKDNIDWKKQGENLKVCMGIFMEMFTNEPGVQCYTGNFQGINNEPNIKHKNGVYPQYVSVCLESQKYPDSPNKADWVQPTLKPGEKYFSHAAYKFSVK